MRWNQRLNIYRRRSSSSSFFLVRFSRGGSRVINLFFIIFIVFIIFYYQILFYHIFIFIYIYFLFCFIIFIIFYYHILSSYFVSYFFIIFFLLYIYKSLFFILWITQNKELQNISAQLHIGIWLLPFYSKYYATYYYLIECLGQTEPCGKEV